MSLKDDVHDDVRSACKSYIEAIKQEEDEVPTDTIFELSGSGLQFRKAREVPRPSLALKRNTGEHYSGEFSSIAEHLSEELDFEMVPEADFDADGFAGMAHDELKDKLEESLRDFTGLVLDYAGDFVFDDTAFEAAYDRQFEPDYADRTEYTIAIPLFGAKTQSGLSLDSNLDLESQFDGPYTISNISVTDISNAEWNGIATFDAPYNAPETDVVQEYSYSNVVKLTITRRRRNVREFVLQSRGDDPTELPAESVSVVKNDTISYQIHDQLLRELVDTLERTFHHYKPRCMPGFGTGYQLAPSWLSYRGLAEDIVDEFYVEQKSGHGELVLENGKNGFEVFWDRYASYFTDEDSQYDKPIVRFEEMFRKRRNEDAILDCLIALEGSLLRGTRGSSYTFRIGLRGSFLLDASSRISWSRERTRIFLRGLYSIRGEIVHQDRTLAEAIDAVDNSVINGFSASQLSDQARVVFANIILRYIDHHIDYGYSIDEVNQDIDQAALDAPYSPGP